jgi:alanine dehydrogenase
LICCFDAATGTPVAVMDGTYVTAVRTAAGSALATRHLARPDARVLSIVGTGVQARAHATLLARRPGIDTVLVAGRNDAKAAALAAELAAQGIAAEAAGSIEAAVAAADIVCAATHADVPVVRRSWLRPGTHVNSVGYNTAGQGEVDGDVLRDAVVVVESRRAVLAATPAGAVEIHRAIDAGLITADHIDAELGEIVAGTSRGRTNDDEITLYKSVGVAVQDAAAAALVLAAARATATGTEVDVT